MTDSNSASLPLPIYEKNSPAGRSQEVRWEVVAQMPGITPATIIAGRLQAEGLPVRVWQEAAGQALGLTVGLLGTGYVAVPEEYAAQAQEILEVNYEEELADWTDAFEALDDTDLENEI